MLRVDADLHPSRPDRIELQSPYTAKDLVKQVPGARWNKDDGTWSVPLSWSSCLTLRGIFREGLVVQDALAKWARSLIENLIDPAMALRDSLGEDIPGDERLYPFQRAGVEFLKLTRRVLLCDEMGSGKTIQALLALRDLFNSQELDGMILVVCPNTVKRTWVRETGVWWPEAHAVLIDGTADKRRRQIEKAKALTMRETCFVHGPPGITHTTTSCTCQPVLIVVNWEALRTHSRVAPFGSIALRRCNECGGTGTVKVIQCEVHKREFNEIDFGAVIADEAHRGKDPHSLQTRALWAAAGDAPIRFAMTGTPIANDASELWSILHFIDEQEWPTKTAWMDRLVDFTYDVFGGMTINGIKPDRIDEFQRTVDPRLRRMPKAVTLPFLPPIVPERRDVEMNRSQKKAYDELATRMLAELDSGMLLAKSPMVQINRLLQLASSYGDIRVRQVPAKDPLTGAPVLDPVTGAAVLVDEDYLVLSDPSSKVDAFMGDLGDFRGQSGIVFAESRQLIEICSERMSKAGIRHGLITGAIEGAARERTIEDFQSGDFQWVLCTLKAGGVGITLTKASVVVCLQRNWSHVEMTQAIARAHRIGSEIHDSILVVDYVTPESAEETQLWSLAHKAGALEEIVRDADLMRKLLRGEPLE